MKSKLRLLITGLLASLLFLTPTRIRAQVTGRGQAFYCRAIGGGTSLYHINVVALEDDTKVEIYSIEKGNLVASATLAKGQVFNYQSSKEDTYKIITTKPAIAYLWGGLQATYTYAGWITEGYATYFPSITGRFVGREFVFLMGAGFLVAFAYEDAQVTLYGEDGSILSITAIRAGSYAVLGQTRWGGMSDYSYESTGLTCSYQSPPHGDDNPHVYRVVSTGDISLAQFAMAGLFTAVPSNTGDFIGRYFLTAVTGFNFYVRYDEGIFDATGKLVVYETYSPGALRIIAHEPALVKVYDVDTAIVIYEKNMIAGEVWEQSNITQLSPVWLPSHPIWNPPGPPTKGGIPVPPMDVRFLRVESTGDISLFAGHMDAPYGTAAKGTIMGDDVTFLAGDSLRVSANDAIIIFAPVDVKLTINGETKSLSKDSFLVLQGGTYHITADHAVIVQINQLGGPGGYDNFGSAIVTTTEATATPPVVGVPLTTYIVVASGIAVVIVAFLFLRRRRKTKPLQ
jgi:hypothetical protein